MWFWKKKNLKELSIPVTPDLRAWLCQAPALMLIRELENNIQSLREEIGIRYDMPDNERLMKNGKIRAYGELISNVRLIRKPKEAVNGKQ